MKKNTIHRNSTLLNTKSKINNGLFTIDNIYCFYKDKLNNWSYKDDITGRIYITTAAQIRKYFDILSQC